MYIDSTGNVSIGSIDAGGNKLYVNGNTNINGSITASSYAGITPGMVSLGNVDNTSDALKPISTATNTALN